MSETLFTPTTLGPLSLAHRVVHAPMTRLRAEADLSPSAMMAVYYGQRASAGGLMITESAHPSFDSRGYLGAPGIYTEVHVAAWQKVTEAVHAKGGRIFMQIAHDGRQSHIDLSSGNPPIAPSVVPFDTQVLTAKGWVPNSPHRALELEEIPALIESFRQGAIRAKEAGFDGVELHNANGYLADTFLQDGTNKRNDAYGGSIAKRARFPLELVEAFASVWGADRVGVRISPSGKWGAISDSNPEATFAISPSGSTPMAWPISMSSSRASWAPRRSKRASRQSPRRSCARSSPARSSPPAASTGRVPRQSCSAAMPISSPSPLVLLQPRPARTPPPQPAADTVQT